MITLVSLWLVAIVSVSIFVNPIAGVIVAGVIFASLLFSRSEGTQHPQGGNR